MGSLQHNCICSSVCERKHATGSHSLTSHSFAKDRARSGGGIYYWVFCIFPAVLSYVFMGGRWWGKQFTNHHLVNCCCCQLSLFLGLLLFLVFLLSDTLLFVGEIEYCGRSFLKCVARITGVINDNTENIIGTCYNE